MRSSASRGQGASRSVDMGYENRCGSSSEPYPTACLSHENPCCLSGLDARVQFVSMRRGPLCVKRPSFGLFRLQSGIQVPSRSRVSNGPSPYSMSSKNTGHDEELSYRLGLVVPSSNTTMETELPEMFRRMASQGGPQLTVHSSRMRMRTVSPEELLKMDAQADRCVEELADAEVDAVAYACLVAVMCQGPAYAAELERRLEARMGESGAPVVTSAGALKEALAHLGARRVSLIAPYLPELTEKVVQDLESDGVEVIDAISLSIVDNLEVGRRSPLQLIEESKRLDVRGADAVILSACVQMPSLAAVPIVEAALGVPVISAATATVFSLRQRFGWDAVIPGAGRLLQGTL